MVKKKRDNTCQKWFEDNDKNGKEWGICKVLKKRVICEGSKDRCEVRKRRQR